MILFSYAFLVFAARGVVIDFFGNESRVEFFIPEGGCWDVSTIAVGMYSIFSSPYFLLTVLVYCASYNSIGYCLAHQMCSINLIFCQ
jgi:hypothetical protein